LTIIGVDIGLHGAVAALDEDGELIAVEDMPCLDNGPAGRRAIDAPRLVRKTQAARAFVEYVSARPGESSVGAFSFGRSRGAVEGVLAAYGIALAFLTPPTWKRAAGIPPGAENKDLARTRAIARWPHRAELFRRKCDVDRAEAALIALAGLERESRRAQPIEKRASFWNTP
jgi:crossover junction endodeoxyribonuclease RuvC